MSHTAADPPTRDTMGAGASSRASLTKEQELELYRRLKGTFQNHLEDIPGAEHEARAMDELKATYFQALQEVAGDEAMVAVPLSAMQRFETKSDGSSFRGPKVVERSSNPQEKMLKSLRDEVLNFCVGDVVSVQDSESDLCFEGLLIGMKEGGEIVNVDFGDGNVEAVPLETCRRVLPWNTIEVGDLVKAQPLDEEMWFDAHVEAVHCIDSQLFYDVKYCDTEDRDCELPAANVNKHSSNRQSIGRLQAIVHGVHAVNYMRKSALNRSNSK